MPPPPRAHHGRGTFPPRGVPSQPPAPVTQTLLEKTVQPESSSALSSHGLLLVSQYLTGRDKQERKEVFEPCYADFL